MLADGLWCWTGKKGRENGLRRGLVGQDRLEEGRATRWAPSRPLQIIANLRGILGSLGNVQHEKALSRRVRYLYDSVTCMEYAAGHKCRLLPEVNNVFLFGATALELNWKLSGTVIWPPSRLVHSSLRQESERMPYNDVLATSKCVLRTYATNRFAVPPTHAPWIYIGPAPAVVSNLAALYYHEITSDVTAAPTMREIVFQINCEEA